jgi:hypothetical protein
LQVPRKLVEVTVDIAAVTVVDTAVVIGAAEAAATGVDITAAAIMAVHTTTTDIMVAAHITAPLTDSLSASADTVGEVTAAMDADESLSSERVLSSIGIKNHIWEAICLC